MVSIEFSEISELFTTQILLIFGAIALVNALLMVAISYKFFQAMQQCGYKGREYLKWLVRKDNACFTRIIMLCILSVLGFFVINMALSVIDNPIIDYSGLILYLFFLAIYFNGERKRKSKIPLVITKRIIRLMVTFVILTVIVSLIFAYGVNFLAIPFSENLLANFRYAILCLCPIIVPYLILLAYYINEPFERANAKRYVKKCTLKLSERKDLIKIGITGSFGKTTVKEILKTLLSEKYNVLATPDSYNTPLGISKTVKRLEDSHEVLICEMGARRVGDIKELTEIIKPDIAVITGITYQHLDTFKVIDNIRKTKFEVIENMKDGKAVFSCDNDMSFDMKKDCKFECRLAGVHTERNPFVYATNIKTSGYGTEFTLNIGDKKAQVKTLLLGVHNVSNICLAVAVADYLGLSIEEIASGIANVKPVKHRLEVIKSGNDLTVIDDSYNANPEGVKCALNVLKEMQGRKFVVTPGLVELGLQENTQNFKIGLNLSTVADGVILVGRARALFIREGLLSAEYPEDKIYMVKDLEEAKNLLPKITKQGDVVLFENDLPDKYDK